LPESWRHAPETPRGISIDPSHASVLALMPQIGLWAFMKLGNAPLKSLLSNATLTTRFAVYSFVCISIMTAALWFLVSHYLINQILDREWQTTAQMVRADVRKFLEDYDFKAQDRKSVGPKFVALLEHMRLAPDIIRFRVYNPKAVVIWSDDKRLVGKSFPENPQLKKALGGAVIADLSSLEESEALTGQPVASTAVQIYVPIYTEDGKEMLGVFETYRRSDGVFQAIHDARLIVLMGAVGGGLLLYLSLFAIVRQAARKIAEQQENLLKMQSELVASQRMAVMGEMAAAVAHGIGNPLSSIRAAAQVAMLEGDGDSGSEKTAKMKENLQSIMQQVDRVQKRMQGLLNFARPLEPHPVRVEIDSVVREVMETMGTRFKDAGVELKLDLDTQLPKVVSDANQLEQALMVLVTNAVEATPKGGSVTIRAKAPAANGATRVCLSIEDTGEGIPAANRQRVFEPFFTTKPHGTGIGLSLAKKFVERNGGAIAISNGSGAGTKVEIIFPAAA
jgi:two-component system sensor histidine kinase HydH